VATASEPAAVTLQLAETLAATTAADLPADTLGHACRAVLDWLGSVLAGAIEPPARMAQRVAAGLGRSDEAMLFAGGRAAAAAAAFANGVASHILELDDIHKGSTVHAAAPIVPAALAIAEREHATGASFLAAVVLGYEAAFRVGEAVNPSHYRFWHPTGTAATFGAAAAAGSLIRLDARKMLHALGSAGTQAAGLWEFNADGSMSKHLHPGKAAFNGILSADLARAGFTGAARILEGDRGFFRAMSAEANPARITDGLGTTWKIGENGYKLYSCCGHTHTAIDVALDLRARRAWSGEQAIAELASIDIDTYGPGYEIVKEANPRSPYQAKFSLAYCVAVALLEGHAGLSQFTPDRFGPEGVRVPAIAALLARTRITIVDGLTRRYPAAWPTRVALTLRDGSVVEAASDYPRGHPENPVATAELQDKLVALVEPRLGRDAATAALAAIDALPRASDMATVFPAILPAHAILRQAQERPERSRRASSA
jgi:2-methylcitrate dehydratase PrpD